MPELAQRDAPEPIPPEGDTPEPEASGDSGWTNPALVDSTENLLPVYEYDNGGRVIVGEAGNFVALPTDVCAARPQVKVGGGGAQGDLPQSGASAPSASDQSASSEGDAGGDPGSPDSDQPSDAEAGQEKAAEEKAGGEASQPETSDAEQSEATGDSADESSEGDVNATEDAPSGLLDLIGREIMNAIEGNVESSNEATWALAKGNIKGAIEARLEHYFNPDPESRPMASAFMRNISDRGEAVVNMVQEEVNHRLDVSEAVSRGDLLGAASLEAEHAADQVVGTVTGLADAVKSTGEGAGDLAFYGTHTEVEGAPERIGDAAADVLMDGSAVASSMIEGAQFVRGLPTTGARGDAPDARGSSHTPEAPQGGRTGDRAPDAERTSGTTDRTPDAEQRGGTGDRTPDRAKEAARRELGARDYVEESGMPEDHFRAMQDAAKETGLIAVVRNTNVKSMPLIEKGAPPKPRAVKAGTSTETGIVTVEAEPGQPLLKSAEAKEAMDAGYYVVDSDGVARRTSMKDGKTVTEELPLDDAPWDPRPGEVVQGGREPMPLAGDYDLMGVIDPDAPGRNISLAASDGELVPDVTNPQVGEFRNSVNSKLDQPRVMHGAQDQYAGFRGGATVFHPDGTVQFLRDASEVQAYYQSIGRQTRVGSYNP